MGLSRIPPEQLVQTVAENLPTFEAIMNYLKGQTEAIRSWGLRAREMGCQNLERATLLTGPSGCAGSSRVNRSTSWNLPTNTPGLSTRNLSAGIR